MTIRKKTRGGDDYETTLESCEKRTVLGSRNEDYRASKSYTHDNLE